MAKSCNCNNDGVKLIYSCSGAANTGYLADSVARQLMKDAIGKMSCLSAIGANLSDFLDSGKSSKKNIVIDGCSIACGKKIFDQNQLSFDHFILTDFDVEKGKTEINTEVINRISKEITEKIGYQNEK